MIRISCRVNLVCRHKSSRATGLACWNADGLLSCSSSSISVASSMIGLSGGVAIARWPPNRSPLLSLLVLYAIVTTARARGPTVSSDEAPPVTPAHRHCARLCERPADLLGEGCSADATTTTARQFYYSIPIPLPGHLRKTTAV